MSVFNCPVCFFVVFLCIVSKSAPFLHVLTDYNGRVARFQAQAEEAEAKRVKEANRAREVALQAEAKVLRSFFAVVYRLYLFIY